MMLYFVRHAIAEEPDSCEGDDASRPLTEDGTRKMREVAAGLASVVQKLDVICSSPLLRALQTAAIVAEAFKHREKTLVWNELKPEAPPESLVGKLRRMQHAHVALVGHQPHMGSAVAYFLTGNADGLHLEFKKGGVCCLQFDNSPPSVLHWFLPPRMARGLSGR
jgi:phosphohistidine phosphatase